MFRESSYDKLAPSIDTNRDEEYNIRLSETLHRVFQCTVAKIHCQGAYRPTE